MKKLSALILGAALCAAGAQAATVSLTYDNSTGPVLTDFGTNPLNGLYSGTAPLSIALNRFDHTLGTLESVSLRLYGDIVTNVTVTTLSSSPSGKVSLGTDLYFSSSIAALNTAINGTDPLNPQGDLYLETVKKNFSLNDTTNKSVTFNNLKDSGELTYSFTDSILLAALTGNSGSTFNLSCSSVSETILSYSGGNATAGQSTLGSCGAEVIYTYSETVTPPAVPEPASLALVGLGLIGVAASRRKSQQA